MSVSTQLPMIECSSCGKIVGHLQRDFYAAVIQLEKIHDDLVNGKVSLEAGQRLLPGLWSKYLGLYYKDLLENSRDPDLYSPKALVAKALLFHRDLRETDLPLNEHERDSGCVKTCCIRMLICDNSEAPY